MKVREYDVFSDCLEAGIDLGWTRAHKHTDRPQENGIKDAIYQAVLDEVCEKFVFDEVYRDLPSEPGDEPGDEAT